MSAPHVEPAATERADYESTPISRSEYIAAIVHLYRGELYRANAWRMRLDNTTNWAVLTTAGVLTYSFGPGEHSHWSLLSGMALISIFLLIESRRFRYADVWRARVRMIEENFYGPILRRDPVSPEEQWGPIVAADLFRPSFKITALEAVRSRLLRNYWAMYAVLLTAWSVKITCIPTPVTTLEQLQARLGGTGIVPWWLAFALVGSFLVACALLIVLVDRPDSYDLHQWRYERDPPSGPTEIGI